MSANSSGSVERFILASGENKTFEVRDPGSTGWLIDLDNEVTRNVDGTLGGTSATVDLRTSEDNVSFTTVGSSVTVVPGGSATLTGRTGRYGQIRNISGGPVVVVAKPTHRVQPVVSL